MQRREGAKTRVYYNAACPVCDAGIRQQKRRLEGSGAEVEWIDVDARREAVTEVGGDLEFVRERLHVVDRRGQIRVGSEAFLALWALTPGQGWLARIGALPLVRTIFAWAYNLFAAGLYRWNRWCRRW